MGWLVGLPSVGFRVGLILGLEVGRYEKVGTGIGGLVSSYSVGVIVGAGYAEGSTTIKCDWELLSEQLEHELQ